MLRRSIAALVALTLTAMAVAGPASAQDGQPATYAAGSSAVALEISIAGTELSFSNTGAAVTSDPGAAANGAALLIAGEEPTSASTPGGPAEAEDCILDEELPAPINLLGLELACVRMVTTGDPSASSESGELEIELISADAVGQVTDLLLQPLLTALLDGLDPLLSLLNLTDTVETIVAGLIAGLNDGDTLATITLAPTSSTASEAQSRGESQGIVVNLLPELLPGLGPIAEIVVGDSFASATADPATGEVTVDGQAAIISVDLAGLEVLLNLLVGGIAGQITGQLPDPLGDILAGVLQSVLDLLNGLDDTIEDLVNVTVDQLGCTPENPLAALLCFSVGGVNELDAAEAAALGYDFGPTTRGVQAEVLNLAVLNALGDDPLLGLSVGGATAAAAAVPAVPATPEQPVAPPDQDRSLPRTGGDAALPLALALLAVGAAGAALIRRTRPV